VPGMWLLTLAEAEAASSVGLLAELI
jgi:hypothetical protein